MSRNHIIIYFQCISTLEISRRAVRSPYSVIIAVKTLLKYCVKLHVLNKIAYERFAAQLK